MGQMRLSTRDRELVSHRRRRRVVTCATILAIFSPIHAFGADPGPPEADSEAYSRLYFGLQPPYDREGERSVEVISELIASGRSSEAAPLFSRFFASRGDALDSSGRSLRRRLLGALDESETQAKKGLLAVLRGEHDRSLREASGARALRDLIGRFPPAVFGVEGLETLAVAEADAGAPEAAALALSLASEVELLKGRVSQAERLARLSAVHRARAGVSVEAGTIEPPYEQAILRSAERASARRAPSVWLGAGGNATRQVIAPGEPELAARAWLAEIGRAEATGSSSDLSPARRSAVAAQGVVIATTPTGLVGLSSESGRKLWRVDDRAAAEGERDHDEPGPGLSSDSRLVFVTGPSHAEGRLQRSPGRSFADGLFDPEPSAPPNCLSAYEIATAGKVRWRLDGGATTGPTAGARFLGPPAVAENRLYVLAEIDQSIKLVELDAETGAVLWEQTLVRCERTVDDYHGAVEVSPTIVGTDVFCPTGRGAVVAVDRISRTLSWVGYLQVDKDQMDVPRQNRWGGMRVRHQSAWAGNWEGWRTCRANVTGERLVVASPAAPVLQAFHAGTGATLWSRELKEGAYFVGVFGDRLAVVESDSMSLWDAADGTPVETISLPEGESPAGEGLMFADSYLLPLSSGRLAVLRDDGSLGLLSLRGADPLSRPPRLGNLLYHQDAVVSCSNRTVESFPMADPASGAGVLVEIPQDLDEGAGDVARAHRSVAGAASESERVGLGDLWSEWRAATASWGDVAVEAEPALRTTARRVVASRLRAAWENATVEQKESLRSSRSLDADSVALFDLGPNRTTASNEAPGDSERAAATFAWSTRQVDAHVVTPPSSRTPTRRTRGSSNTDKRRAIALSFASDVAATTELGPVSWAIELQGGRDARLTGDNRHGERTFAEDIPRELPPPSSGGDAIGAAGHHRWREWLALNLAEGFALYRAGGIHDAENGLAWVSDQDLEAGWPYRVGEPESREAPVAIGPWGVVSVFEGTLRCRDLSSGAIVWRRDAPTRGDGEVRVLASGHRLLVSAETGDAAWLSAWSGEKQADAPGVPPPKSWRGLRAGRLLVDERTDEGRRFRVVDLVSPRSDTLWESPVATSTRVVVDQELVCFLSKSNRLRVVDLDAARERFETQLEEDPKGEPVQSFAVHRRQDSLVVAIDRSNPLVDRASGALDVADFPLMTGRLHCLDPRTGEALWPSPATVQGLALLGPMPRAAPLLLLGRRISSDDGQDATQGRLALVALDLATGSTLYSDFRLPAEATQEAEVGPRVLHESTPDGERLVVRYGPNWVTLQTTDSPAPPRPTMLADVEDPDSRRPTDPEGLGRGVERLLRSFWDSDYD